MELALASLPLLEEEPPLALDQEKALGLLPLDLVEPLVQEAVQVQVLVMQPAQDLLLLELAQEVVLELLQQAVVEIKEAAAAELIRTFVHA